MVAIPRDKINYRKVSKYVNFIIIKNMSYYLNIWGPLLILGSKGQSSSEYITGKFLSCEDSLLLKFKKTCIF